MICSEFFFLISMALLKPIHCIRCRKLTAAGECNGNIVSCENLQRREIADSPENHRYNKDTYPSPAASLTVPPSPSPPSCPLPLAYALYTHFLTLSSSVLYETPPPRGPNSQIPNNL